MIIYNRFPKNNVIPELKITDVMDWMRINISCVAFINDFMHRKRVFGGRVSCPDIYRNTSFGPGDDICL
jgi:hypothetical protein